MKRRSPMPGQVLQVVPVFDNEGYDGGSRYDVDTDNVEAAHVITSRVAGSTMHKLIIDLDLPAKLLPSTSKDHYHLYVDHPMTWRQYVRILKALEAAGIIQRGYLGASKQRGYTAVRLPWVKKHHAEVN